MIRTQFLDLDVLDSPVLSVNSPTLISSSRPGSSIAEKIFNDPDSWHDSRDMSIDDGEANVMTWLAEELEKSDDNFGDGIELWPTEQGTIRLKHLSGEYTITQKPTNTLPRVSGYSTQREGIPDYHDSFLPVLERSGLDLSMELNIKSFNRGSTFSPQSLPSPIIFSPPSSSSTSQSVESPITSRTKVPLLDLAAQSEEYHDSTPLTSPVPVPSASTTWSILELYGVRPDTPDSGHPMIGAHHPSPLLPVPSVAHLTTPRRNTSPRIPTPRSILAAKPTNETALIRPLPLVPDSVRDPPASPCVETPDTPSRKRSKSPLLPSQTPNYSPPPTVMISQPVSHRVSNHRLTQSSDVSPVPRLKVPGTSRKPSVQISPQLPHNSRLPSTLTRFVSLPLLSSRLAAVEPVSPSATPHLNRPGSTARSPPLGPRPRSSTTRNNDAEVPSPSRN